LVEVPAPERDPHHEVDLIPVNSIDEYWQKPFNVNNVDRFNIIQSTVFHDAFNTKKNLLICAPTGAGKTNIALLTILEILKSNFC